jgi:hypothetical protein
MARLRDGVNEAGAAAEFSSAMRELAAAFPETNGRIGGELIPYWRAPRGPQMMFLTALGILQGVMLLVLLAVCGNTANLVLARASTRHREVGVRLALGARPSSVIRLMLAENLLLGILGAAVGIVIAWWGTEALRAMPPYGAFPVKFQTSLDAVGLAFAVVLGIGCGLLFGFGEDQLLARLPLGGFALAFRMQHRSDTILLRAEFGRFLGRFGALDVFDQHALGFLLGVSDGHLLGAIRHGELFGVFDPLLLEHHGLLDL